jgi:hypothetical protein
MDVLGCLRLSRLHRVGEDMAGMHSGSAENH